MKKHIRKVVVSLLTLSILIPTYSVTANAQIVEFLDYYKPQDARTGLYEFEHYDTDWEATVHPYIENLNRARSEAIAKVAQTSLLAEQDKTGYPFVKIPARDYLCNYDIFSYSDNNGYYFDSKTYATMYPEVKAKYGNTHKALWTHYKTKGVYEGRVAHTSEGCLCGYDVMTALQAVWTPEMTDREKVIFVNNHIKQACFPTETNEAISEKDPVTGENSTYASVYAFMFNEIMRQLGIPCFVEKCQETNKPQQNIYDSDWNQVYIDGKWYVVDVYMNDYTNSDKYLLIDRHPLAYPDYWAAKNIQVYSIKVLKETYTESDLQAGIRTKLWGPIEDMQMFLDQDFADALIEDYEKELIERNNTKY